MNGSNLCVYVQALPLEVAARLWDVYLFEGEVFVCRAALGILRMYAPKLCTQSMEEIMSFLINIPQNVDADILLANIDQIRISKRRFEEMRTKMTNELHIKNGTSPAGANGSMSAERRPSGSTSTFKSIKRAIRTTFLGSSSSSSSSSSQDIVNSSSTHSTQSTSSHGSSSSSSTSRRVQSQSVPDLAASARQQHNQEGSGEDGTSGTGSGTHMQRNSLSRGEAVHHSRHASNSTSSSATNRSSTGSGSAQISGDGSGHGKPRSQSLLQQQQDGEYTGGNGAVDTYTHSKPQAAPGSSSRRNSGNDGHSSRRGDRDREREKEKERDGDAMSPKSPSSNADCVIC
jgi:hypothetical protein